MQTVHARSASASIDLIPGHHKLGRDSAANIADTVIGAGRSPARDRRRATQRAAASHLELVQQGPASSR